MNSTEGKILTGGEILMESLLHNGVDVIFGYPGGSIMPTYNNLYDYTEKLRHILVRHEQGAIHAAQGYARACGRTGCVIVTSGPGATNVLTGIADAMIDSTPVVVIAGQVANDSLGTDAFQETDLIGLTTPITKWSYQIRRPEDVAWAVSRAFYIAGSGRPGPVVLDFTKTAQIGKAEYHNTKCKFIRSYVPVPELDVEKLSQAAVMISQAKKPFVVYGQGITLSGAEKELAAFLDKTGIPAGSTMLGLSALPSDNPHYVGMLGMHGNLACNVLTQHCDLLIAVGMRFSDRVTGNQKLYAKNARIIHIDIDAAEIGKCIRVDLGINADAKTALKELTAMVSPGKYEWTDEIEYSNNVEKKTVIADELNSGEEAVFPGEVVDAVARIGKSKALIVTDVGENQLIAARYSRFAKKRSMITSGGLGTMGFGIPAAIGAKVAEPERMVCAFVGDGGFQMTEQELGTIMQEQLGVKIVLLNNNWLGNVRLWQELFFKKRYSFTRLANPDFKMLAEAYGIKCVNVEKRSELEDAVKQMFADDKPFILNVHVYEKNMVFPMVPPGKSLDQIMLNPNDTFEYGN